MKVIRHDEGTPLKVLGDNVTIKVFSHDSPNGQSIVEVEVPPGSGTPCVTHAKEEEVYLILEGELLMHAQTERHLLQPGDMVHLPPMTPHGYRNPGTQTTRFMAWTVGGPMDRFFVQMAEHVRALPQDIEAMKTVMAECGVERVS